MSSPEGVTDDGRIALAEDAPDVDLVALILENCGLGILESHPIVGRSIVAMQDLGESLLYQPILRELPALVCIQEDYLDFIEQFLDAPVELQVGILDMFYQPLDSEMGKALLQPAKLLFQLGAIEDLTVIHQLLSIFMTNGHSYRGTHAVIPLFGSKFAHSCNPNISYSSVTSEDGALEYKLLRGIKEGELVCFSYLSDILETPTFERRQLLMKTKSFRCICERCAGRDFLRCLSCPNNCYSKVPCQYQAESDEAFWECNNCGMLEREYLETIERQFRKTLEVLERRIENRKDFDKMDSETSPQIVRDLASECRIVLSQTHYLTIKSLRMLLTTSTTHAYVQVKQRVIRGLPASSPRIHSLFRLSVVAGLELVLAGECVAADCVGCQVESSDSTDRGLILEPKHEPNYDRALVFRHIYDNMVQLPLFWWPPSALRMATRYLPLMQARFGRMVDPIGHRIHKIYQTVYCFEAGTYWDSIHATTSPLPSPESKQNVVGSSPSRQNAPSSTQTDKAKKPGSSKKKSNKKKNRRK